MFVNKYTIYNIITEKQWKQNVAEIKVFRFGELLVHG